MIDRKTLVYATIGILIAAIALLVYMIFSVGRNRIPPSVLPTPVAKISYPIDISGTSVPPTQPPDPTKVYEQLQEDKGYADWERQTTANYPWLLKLPARDPDNKYFIYFDTNKKKFIGLLYPKPGDDVEQIKQRALESLATEKDIPTHLYTFDWTVY